MNKRFFIFVGILLFILSGCRKNPNIIEISGKITNAEGKMIYLEELLVANLRPVDSAKINKNGEFRLRQKVEMPTFFLLKLSDNNFVTLLLDTAETVNIRADALNFSREYLVEGSPGSELVYELNTHLSKTKHRLDSISTFVAIFSGSDDYGSIQEQSREAAAEIIAGQIEYSTNFVNTHPFSMASVLALYQKFDDENYVIQDLQALKTAASALNSFYPNSDHVKALYNNALQLLQRERDMKLNKLVEEAGVNTPEIILPNPDGQEIALSSLLGKYVLVHFWSAVDQNSRILNSALVEAYDKYKRKGFEIYQVSVDKDREHWVNAIKTDRLTWTNVGDMQGSISAVMHYNIQSVPYNYLLDPEGVIIAQNLAGPMLDKTLSSVYK